MFKERHISGITILDLSGHLTHTAGSEMWSRVGVLKLLNPSRRAQQLLVIRSLTSVPGSFESEAAALASFTATAT